MYNPATNLWTPMTTLNAPSARILHTAVWNNVAGRMIIWGGSTTTFSGETNTGGIFNPVTNLWEGATNTAGAPSARNNHTAIWTGTEMITFGGLFNTTVLNTGGKYNFSTNTWIATNVSGAPSVDLHSAVWIDTAMFISTGNTSNSYNPITNLWKPHGGYSSNAGKVSHSSFLAGNMILIWGGTYNPNTGYRYFLTNNIVSSATTLTNETLYLYQKN